MFGTFQGTACHLGVFTFPDCGLHTLLVSSNSKWGNEVFSTSLPAYFFVWRFYAVNKFKQHPATGLVGVWPHQANARHVYAAHVLLEGALQGPGNSSYLSPTYICCLLLHRMDKPETLLLQIQVHPHRVRVSHLKPSWMPDPRWPESPRTALPAVPPCLQTGQSLT